MHVHAALAQTTPLHVMEAEDLATALFRLEGGGTATMFATTAAYPGFAEVIEIVGRLGTARLSGGALTVHFLDGRTEAVAADERSGHGAGAMDFSHHAHRALIVDFLDAVDQGRPPLTNGAEALATQALIEAIVAAAS